MKPMVEADLAVVISPEHFELCAKFADYLKRDSIQFFFSSAPVCPIIRQVFVYLQATVLAAKLGQIRLQRSVFSPDSV